jgi:hypothetical protein
MKIFKLRLVMAEKGLLSMIKIIFFACCVGTKTAFYQDNFAISKLGLLLIANLIFFFLMKSIDNTRSVCASVK